MFKSKSAFDRQKWVTAKNLFKKAHTHASQCRLLEVIKKLDRKICGVNGCNIQHNYLLHLDRAKASVNIFTVLEEEDATKEMPASEDVDEDEDDQSPRARLMSGILQAGGPAEENQESDEDSPEDQVEAVREAGTTSEEEKKLEPEKEKNP